MTQYIKTPFVVTSCKFPFSPLVEATIGLDKQSFGYSSWPLY